MDKKAYLEDLLGRMGMVWPDGGPGARETRKTIRAALKEAKKLEDPDYLPVLQQLALERPGGDEASRSYRKAAYSTILAILWNRLDPDGDSFFARYMPGLFAAYGRRRPDPQQPDLEALSFLISRLDAEPEREDQWLLINYLGAGDFGTNRLPIPEVLDLGPLLRLAKSEDTELRKDALRVLIRCPSAARLFFRGRLEEGGQERYPDELAWMIDGLNMTGTAEDIPLLEGYRPVYKKRVKFAVDAIRQREEHTG